MKYEEKIKEIRESLNLTQVQFGQLLGVHHMTVSKWERDVSEPSPYQTNLIECFRVARMRNSTIGKETSYNLVHYGTGVSLYRILHSAFTCWRFDQ